MTSLSNRASYHHDHDSSSPDRDRVYKPRLQTGPILPEVHMRWYCLRISFVDCY